MMRLSQARGSARVTAPLEASSLSVGITTAVRSVRAGSPAALAVVLGKLMLSQRLQRSPQLAQATGGLSDRRASRNDRYAGPFQISRRVCSDASPSVQFSRLRGAPD